MASNYREVAAAAARKYRLPENIFLAQINQESGFNPNARSPAGAEGIAQIMPDTAKGWGVDPMDPVAALDAAARNMAEYVKQYGSIENALRAYNAGGGNIEASHGFAETNNYVKTILANARNQGSPSHASPMNDVTRANVGGTSPQITQDAPEDTLGTVLSRMNASLDPNTTPAEQLQNTVASLQRIREANAPQATPTAPTGVAPSASNPGGATKPGNSANIYELFFDPLGGWKKGQSIGPIGGHSDHVHVAADPGRTRWLLHQAQDRFGLTVRENKAFDPVDPVHAPGSYHYKDEAGDVSGPRAQEEAYVNWIRKKYGLK